MNSQQHPSQLKINKMWLHLCQQQHNHDHQIMQNPSSSSLSLPSPTNLVPPHPHTNNIPLKFNHNPSSSLPSLTNLFPPPHPRTNIPLRINHNPSSSSLSRSPLTTNGSPFGIPDNNPPLLQMIQNPNGEIKVDSGELTAHSTVTSSLKRKRGRPRGSRKKLSLANSGLDLMPPQVVSVDVAEDKQNDDAKTHAEMMMHIHQQTQENIKKATEQYVNKASKGNKEPTTYQVGDLVWIYLRKERFPQLRKNNLMPQADGPFQVIAKFGDNAYTIDLPPHYTVSPIFNVGDLRPYYDDTQLGTIVPEGGGDEPNPSPNEGTNMNNPDNMDVHGLERTKEASKILVILDPD